jgi:hypothetical protein
MSADNGVNPLGETREMNTIPCSLLLSGLLMLLSSKIRASGEAEASSAGEQLAKEYPAGNSSRRWWRGISTLVPLPFPYASSDR